MFFKARETGKYSLFYLFMYLFTLTALKVFIGWLVENPPRPFTFKRHFFLLISHNQV